MIYICAMALTFYTQSKKEYSPIWVRYRQHSIDAKARTLLNVETGRLKHNKILKHKMTPSSDAHQKMLITEKNKALDIVQKQIQLLQVKILSDINNIKETDTVNSKWLTRAVQPKLADLTFIENFDLYLDSKKSLTAKTLVNLKSVKKILEAFQDDTNTTLYLLSINANFKNTFVKWCEDVGYSKTTQKLYLTKIKGVCFHFELEGEKINPYVKILTKDIVAKKKNQIFFTIEEIEIITNLKLDNKHLDNARDWLVLSFWIGQRHSDFNRLTKKNIYPDKTIRLTQQKTKTKVKMVITHREQQIIDKYNGGFPKPITSGLYNQRIKRVSKLAGLNEMIATRRNKGFKNGNKSGEVIKPKYELVSSHIGRRSFVTHFYGKMKIEDIMSQTGHKTESSFYTYLNEARDFDVERVRKTKIDAS